MNIQTQANNVKKQIEGVNEKVSEMNDFLRKTKFMAFQMDEEKYEVLKDRINELLQKKNYNNIKNEIQHYEEKIV
jgi:conjugal transfer/entry exclusion protein